MVLQLFRSILPRNDRFIAAFSEHSSKVVEAAHCFRRMMDDAATGGADYEKLVGLEAEADVITRQTIQAIHRTYVAPFDRSEILDLITGLDDIVDLMKEAGREIGLYGVEFTPEMRGMGDAIIEATTVLRQTLPLLEDISRNAEAINRACAGISVIESRADDLFARGLHVLFKEKPGMRADKIFDKLIYDLIEKVVDRCEDVADMVTSIVIEHV